METGSPAQIRSPTRQGAGLVAGIAVHVLFAYTVWHLYWFLQAGRPTPDVSKGRFDLGVDALLALLFAVPHSLLLWPPVRKRLGHSIPPAFYGLFYTVVTCLSLLVVFAGWRGVGPVLWQAQGHVATAVTLAFGGSWIALFYSLHLTGLGYQTEWTPWRHWLAGRPVPRRGFTPRGAYLWLRHPVYLSFAGLVWFTPRMTADHALLTGLWTIYLLAGSWLKDERLAYYLGESYRQYQRKVSGYPLMFAGPLARRDKNSEAAQGTAQGFATAPLPGSQASSPVSRPGIAPRQAA